MNPLQKIIFRDINGIWKDAEGRVLADVLASYEIVVDDRCEFARLKDYERMVSIWYRATAGLISITIWRLCEV